MIDTSKTLDLPAGMFRSAPSSRETTIMIGRTNIGLVNDDVKYAAIDGLALFEGDILLGTVDEVERGERAVGARSIGVAGAQFRWPTPTIPYITEDGIRERVVAAMAAWSAKTPFTFVPRTTERDFLSFKQLNGCFSSVGRQGNEQTISIGIGCGLGAAIHEIGHSLGLWHEQSRADRDEHISVLLENVDPQQRHNFDKHILDGTDLGDYDFGSIMHYPKNAFSVNGRDTIRTKQGESIGQRNGLSAGDIAGIKKLYPHFDWTGK